MVDGFRDLGNVGLGVIRSTISLGRAPRGSRVRQKKVITIPVLWFPKVHI